ncbi:riboflavin kinase/FMN adenylyltransferase [Nocardioides sp. BE266]|uniref:adenylyltransferase/cytidyltransferase family protein n=1 Tax=Nocardioides sp. BE266 TaxID=2817725 RepID=UPI002861A7A6|nr:adenylyltransferase/cytidyltransferase family protein [Nocardioides sp. BE266]MDR7255098.1 riboflavin kinase/FMN adenylyltransferase [Nocardioides sp. BE266]
MSDTLSQQVWRDWPALAELDASVVTVGVFDGFHRGHVALVEAALAEGRRLGLPTVLVTFEPHPLVVLAPERAPRQLLSVDDRVEQALSLGLDGVVVLPFTRELAAQPAADFVEQGLVARLGVRSLVVGDNFHCGRGGEGDVAFLAAAGRRLGFDVSGVDLVCHGERTCSSTEVRRALAAGDLATARDLLGRSDPRIAAVVD